MNYYRETEDKMHQMLYGNLKLLKEFYPTSKELNSVCKVDMFVHNNRAAFHHVGHYLLMVINATLTKEKISTWPCFDIKTESKFRSEFLTCINHLRLIENSGIPPIMASHLISPGGYKFTHFIFSLSQLALVEHIKRERIDIIDMPTPSKNIEITKNIIKTLKTKTSSIEEKSIKLRKDFEETKQSYIEKAEIIADKIAKINKDFIALQEQQSSTQKCETKSFENRLEIIESKIALLDEALSDIKIIETLSKDCLELVVNLTDNCSKFEYHPSSKISNDLDMCELFEEADVLLKFISLSSPVFNPSEVTNAKKTVSDVTNRYYSLNKSFKDLQNKIRSLFKNMNDLPIKN